MEWIDPRYADLMRKLKAAEQERRKAGDERPVRGFILPDPR